MLCDVNLLTSFLTGENERVGLVLKDGTVVELENICHDPKNGFEVDAAELVKYYSDAVATWHTHPDATSNLSVGDLQSYLNYPELTHYLVGTDGVATYFVENGRVLRAEDAASDPPARIAQEDPS